MMRLPSLLFSFLWNVWGDLGAFSPGHFIRERIMVHLGTSWYIMALWKLHARAHTYLRIPYFWSRWEEQELEQFGF